ncbi:hypothetical protein [Photobacterium sp. R1]
MNQFFSSSKVIEVSRLSKDGWWLENCHEHVAKGTSLGQDFTQNLYVPSAPGMIARYDRISERWSEEIKDMSYEVFYSESGEKYVIGEPDGQYPDWAITESPPEYDNETQTVLYQHGHGWSIYPILIGEKYYNQYGVCFEVSDFNFVLPEGHTFITPPKTEDGFSPYFSNGEWRILEDNRGKFAYAKSRVESEDYEIQDLEPLPATHCLEEPGDFDSWEDGKGWVYDIERHRPIKSGEERNWRDSELRKVIDRIDQYERDQNYPPEMRTSPIQSEEAFMQLLNDRKLLSEYPEQQGFPFGERPVLSGLA